MDERELAALLDVSFSSPGRAVEHWENWLLTDCTRRAPMPDGLLHPVVLFHLPIQAAGTSIAELFELGGSDGSAGAVGLNGYDWEYLAPMREGVVYSGAGRIVSAERFDPGDGSDVYDDVSYTIELCDPGEVAVARITNHWRFRRGPGARGPKPEPRQASESAARLPELVTEVGVDRMKTMAALLRDPYPVHWDPDALRAAGLGDRAINQGPLNLSYVMNMLMAHAGEGSLRSISIAFHGVVRDGDTVVAGGSIDRELVIDGEPRLECTIWLDRGDQRMLSGTAQIVTQSG